MSGWILRVGAAIRAVATALTITALWLDGAAALQPAPGPVDLPAPSGIYPVGTIVLHVTDHARRDSLADVGRPREVTAQVWYPGDAVLPAARARYLIDAGLLEALLEESYYGQAREVLEGWAAIRTHAGEGVAIATGRRPFPVLLLSHGLGVSRVSYTSIAQDLASHGNIVVALDHPYGGVMVLSDGRVLTTAGRRDLETPEGIRSEVRRWARDASAVLDRLLSAADSVSGVPLAVRADPERVGYLGHSLGGAAAWQACLDDPRFRACAGLDGTLRGDFEHAGFASPTLVLQSLPDYSDADLAAAGRTRQEWDSLGASIEGEWEAVLRVTDAPVTRLWLRGFGHMSYGDAGFVMPNTISRFGGRIVGPDRSAEIVSAFVRAFFDAVLSGHHVEWLAAPGPLWPEVRVGPP